MSGDSLLPILSFVLAERNWSLSPHLARMAECLPAVPLAGLELRLTEPDRADLQQGFRSRDDALRLARFCATPAGAAILASVDPDRLTSLFESGACEEAWLELDDTGPGAAPPVSLFVRLPPDTQAREGLSRVQPVLDSLGVRPAPHYVDTATRLLAACPPEALISHFGLMAGRPGAPFRLNIDRLDPGTMFAWLVAAGWTGDPHAAGLWAERMFAHADRVRLAVTIGDTLHPELGLEVFTGPPNLNGARWAGLLDTLTAHGLCLPDIAQRIRNWPLALYPSPAGRPWPERLIMDSLARGRNRIAWIDCRLSHVKITLGPDGTASAKAYLGFEERVETIVQPHRAVTAASASCRHADAPESARHVAALSDAIRQAVAFILSARSQGGWWADFRGFDVGPSDAWVTAYAAYALAGTSGPDARAAAERAWNILATQAETRPDRPGWGWNYALPPDADSTTWAIRLAGRLGHGDGDVARRALHFVRDHVTPEGLVRTYQSWAHDHWCPGNEISPEWYLPHTCVAAAAAGLAPVRDLVASSLLGLQRADGAWQAYWWHHDGYATAMAAEALADIAPSAATRAAAWASGHVDTNGALAVTFADDFAREQAAAFGNAFDMALALRLMLLDAHLYRMRISALAGRILAEQNADGSWTGSAFLAFPTHDGRMNHVRDSAALFTTATVIEALVKLSRCGTRL